MPEAIVLQPVVLRRQRDAVGPSLALSLVMMLTQTLDRRPTQDARLDELLPIIRRIRCEYQEMPGLMLTEAQARRLWSLDGRTCRRILTVLLERQFLRRTAAGLYVRAYSPG
jgi:hypothetical protein